MKRIYEVWIYENAYSGVLKRKTNISVNGKDAEDCAMKAIELKRKLCKGSEYAIIKRIGG